MSSFVGYPESTRRFYSDLIYAAVLNEAAVRHGLFPTLICDGGDETFIEFAMEHDRIAAILLGAGAKDVIQC